MEAYYPIRWSETFVGARQWWAQRRSLPPALRLGRKHAFKILRERAQTPKCSYMSKERGKALKFGGIGYRSQNYSCDPLSIWSETWLRSESAVPPPFACLPSSFLTITSCYRPKEERGKRGRGFMTPREARQSKFRHRWERIWVCAAAEPRNRTVPSGRIRLLRDDLSGQQRRMSERHAAREAYLF